TAGAAWVLCRRLRPALRLSPFRVSVAGCHEIMSLGMRFQGVVLLGTAIRQGIRMAISGLCGTAALGTFHLADRMLFVARVPVAAEFATLLTASAASGLRAAGTVRLELIFGLANAALVVAGLAIGYPLAGYAGIVVAITCGRTVTALWFLERFASFSKLH